MALAIFIVAITPDMLWNLASGPSNGDQVSYGNHLARIQQGLTLNRHYLLFYIRDAAKWAYGLVGKPFWDPGWEYPTMNSIYGFLLLGCVAWTSLRFIRQDSIGRFLLCAFWVVFGFFLLIKTGETGDGVLADHKAWWWVDLTLVPATAMTAAVLANQRWMWVRGLRVTSLFAVVYAIVSISVWQLGLPRVKIEFFPSRREARFDRTGSMIEVRGCLIPSMLLAHSTSLELIDVERKLLDGSYRSGLGTPDVEGAEQNEDDLIFSVRSGLDVRYRVTYRVTEASGREHVLHHVLRFGPSGPMRRKSFLEGTR